MPALRERKSDVPTLVHYFLDRFAPERMLSVSPAAMKCMLQYEWPGNVRELENAIERAVALGSEETLEMHDLPPALRNGHEIQPVSEPAISQPKPAVSDTDLEELERVTIQRVFEQVNGDKALAGKMLGISRATLYRKLKRYNIGLAKSASAAS
jgi:DNA-binding NtrC family response regulator